MGNNESLSINTNFSISTHRPLDSGLWISTPRHRIRTSIHIQSSINHISSATLPSPPILNPLYFPCPSCKSLKFDGGFSKIVICSCGLHLKRSNTGRIMQLPESNPNNFASNFDLQLNSPKYSYIPELVTLNLAVFRQGLPELYISAGMTVFSSLFDQVLSEFFAQGIKCLGVGDYFKVENLKFKVLGAFPNYGLVTENTVISCKDIISERSIERVHILPILPTEFDENIFLNAVQPYFRKLPRHIFENEYLYIDGNSFLVIASHPNEGIITSETQFFFTGQPLEPIQFVSVSPFLEDLTYHYNTLSQEALIEEVLNKYVMPYFQGFKRLVALNETFTINGVTLKVIDCWPRRGVVVDSSAIIYDGSMCQREGSSFYGPNTLLIRRGNMMEDPLYVLSQQMYQMQQIMMDVGGPDQEGTPDSVINSLPTKIVQENSEDEESKCTVCLCDYQINESVKILTCCNSHLGHVFHSTCIDEWLRRSKVCPLCKRLVS